MRKVTIEDITRQTGLSRGTVSRVLNNRTDVNPETKRKVLTACSMLNYTPSHAARSLATGRSMLVALVSRDLGNPLIHQIAAGFVERAARDSYAVQLIELGDDPSVRTQRLQLVTRFRIDGVLICDSLRADEAAGIGQRMENRAISAIVPVPGVACDLFMVDESAVGRLIGAYLSPYGVAGVYLRRSRAVGAAARLRAARGSGAESAQVVDGDLAAVDWSRARAIAADHDSLAISAMLWAAGAGRSVGRDIQFLGVGNTAVGAQISPGLSTIDFCGADIGRRAFETMLGRIHERRGDRPERVLVGPRLVERGTARVIRS